MHEYKKTDEFMADKLVDDFILFAQNEPQLAIGLALVGAVLIFFFINMIGGDKKE